MNNSELCIYAVRDRLIDYYMQPFVAPNDKVVLASLASHINNPKAKDAVSQAPHHFEIWRLGRVQIDGTLVNDRELLADASSLIRAGVRNGASPGDGPIPQPLASGSTSVVETPLGNA